jgi:uncharacterized membrane protein
VSLAAWVVVGALVWVILLALAWSWLVVRSSTPEPSKEAADPEELTEEEQYEIELAAREFRKKLRRISPKDFGGNEEDDHARV